MPNAVLDDEAGSVSLDLKTKANIAFILALAAIAGMCWLSLVEGRRLKAADRWVSHSRDVLERSAALRSHISDAAIARRAFLQGDLDKLDAFDRAVTLSELDFSSLVRLTADNPQQLSRLKLLDPLVQARIDLLRRSIAVHKSAKNDQAIQQTMTDQGTRITFQFVTLIHEFDTAEQELLSGRSSALEASTRRTIYAGAILGVSVFFTLLAAMVMLNRELSRRLRAERAIADHKALLESILNSCNDAVIVVDRAAKLLLRNPAASRLHGNVPPDRLNRSLPEIPGLLGFYKPDGVTLMSHVELPLWRAVQGESVDNVEMCVRPAGGESPRWVLASARPLRSAESDDIQGGVVFYRDVTDRKKLENELSKQSAELKRSNKELEQFAYVASHDLQEPLRTVAGCTQLLAKRYKARLDADADEYITHVVNGVVRMQSLIRDLLAYSRVGNRRREYQPSSSQAAVEQAVANLQTAIQESGAVVTRDHLPDVLADESELIQVFQNLIGNAIKYRRPEPPEIHVSARESSENEWTFSVSDNGIGIEPQYYERIFGLFQRLHGRNEYSGTGIGLTITKKIVESHGGRIWVESEAGKGSCFNFTLGSGAAVCPLPAIGSRYAS